MSVEKIKVEARGIRFSIKEGDKDVGRAFLYVMYNDLHEEPFGLLEDVYVEESTRGKGYGTQLVKEVLAEAKRLGCYKLIATSRFVREKVHEWYEKLGFERYGNEFRINL